MRLISLGLALLLIAACTPGAGTGAPQPGAQLNAAAITASCGGGFTGGSVGVTITGDDHVISWEQATAAAPRSETDLGPDPAFAADVRRQLSAINFAGIDYSEVGNMTCSLSVGEHSVSWEEGDPNAPPGAVDVFERVYSVEGRE
jgi:hypothetical protein